MEAAHRSLPPSDPTINASVSASAGTGKTFLLVSRLIRLLLSGARPDSILALTFTRKAAAEMQQRLEDRIYHLACCQNDELTTALQQCGIESPDKNLCIKARQLYENILFSERPVRISTFHAFCQSLLQRFPLEANIPPGFELTESTELLKDLAWDALFLESTKAPDSHSAIALERLFEHCNGLHNTREALLSGFLEHRSDWWAFVENQIDPVQYAIEQLEQTIPPISAPCSTFLEKQHDNVLIYSTLLGKHTTATNLSRIETIEHALNSTIADNIFHQLTPVFLTADNKLRSQKLSKTLISKLGNKDAETFLALHETIGNAILDTHDAILQNNALEANKAWFVAGNALLQHYQRIKEEQRILDFSDLEWKSYCLLRHAENALWIQFKLDEKIDHLLIDEFQDTNPTQWQLILPLLEEIAGGRSERQRSVFLVGDTKQSIYGFRRANPELQNTACTWLKDNLNAPLFTLSLSRRSSPAIITTLNTVFDGTAIGNQLDSYTPHSTFHKNLWGATEILPLINVEKQEQAEINFRDPLTEGRHDKESLSHYQEGLQIAQRIQTLIKNKTLVRDHESIRPVEFGDIIILLKNRNHAIEYERAFSTNNIPYIGIEQNAFFEALEVSDLEALLNYLTTPYNNLLLVQLLRSPIFNISNEELIKLSSSNDNPSWDEKLKQYIQLNNPTDELARAYTLLNQWKTYSGQLPVHDLLDKIYHEGDILPRYKAATPEPSQAGVIANITAFIKTALEIDSGRYPSMASFISRLKKMRAGSQEKVNTESGNEQTSAVQFMTIHAAKGLEAPVVFLADSAVSSGKTDTYTALVDWPAAHEKPEKFMFIQTTQKNPRLIKSLLEKQVQQKSKEQANLLYVALSRAKQFLFISGTSDKNTSDKQGWYGIIKESMTPVCEEGTDGTLIFNASTQEMKATPIEKAVSNQYKYPDKLTESTYKNHATNDITKEQPSIEQLEGIFIHFYLQQLCMGFHELEKLPHTETLPAISSASVSQADRLLWQQEAINTYKNPSFSFIFNDSQFTQAWSEVSVSYIDKDSNTIHGIIDRLVLNDETLWIIDYKTATYKDPNTAIETYKEQLTRYKNALQAIHPNKQIKTGLLLTKTQNLIEVYI